MELVRIGNTNRLLGVQIGATSDITKQWDGLVKSLAIASAIWESNKYPLLIKARASKIFLHSKFQYLANFSIPPPLALKLIKKIIWQVFFGKHTTSRVTFEKCIAPVDFGGLNAFCPTT